MTAKKPPALVQHRLQQAQERLTAARILLDAKSYNDSLSRSYYAIFSAARALLATKQLDSRKHSGVISLFNQHFVKEDIIDKQLGRYMAEAKGFREESDYGDYATFTHEDAETQISNAEKFITEVERALKS